MYFSIKLSRIEFAQPLLFIISFLLDIWTATVAAMCWVFVFLYLYDDI